MASQQSPRSPRFVDDTEDPDWEVSPGENVYSYFMFITPTEFKKEGSSFTWDTAMAYFLVIMNFFMQGVLLYTIYNEVVVGNIEWQDSIMRAGGQEWNLFAPRPGGCNDGGSLCVFENNTYTCAPPSVQLTGRWNELDTNGDGIWTFEEVSEAREKLKCKYVVDPVEVFRVFQTFLLARENIIWIHPDLRAGKAIHKAYFTYAAGDIIMCGYRNDDMCPNLLKRGVFHAPLKYNTAPRVGNTIDSALEYCYNLLSDGGMCERTLPSTYSVWKIQSSAQCGGPSYHKMVYKNPGNKVQKSLLSVDYTAREDYERAKTTGFKIYKAIIICLWLLAMLVQYKDITMLGTWVLRFPGVKPGEEMEAVTLLREGTDEEQFQINAITSGHRMAMGILVILRLFLTTVLAYVGVSYLMKSTDYIGLLMDAVALVFIVEISDILYAQTLRPAVQDQCSNIASMIVPMYGIDWLNRRPAIVDFIQLCGLLLVTVIVMWNHYVTLVNPLYDAIECTCLSRGEKCFEAQTFSYEFWHKYWKEEVPAVFDELDRMKARTPSAGPAAAPAPGVESANDAAQDSDEDDNDDEDEASPSPAPSPDDDESLVAKKSTLFTHNRHERRHREMKFRPK